MTASDWSSWARALRCASRQRTRALERPGRHRTLSYDGGRSGAAGRGEAPRTSGRTACFSRHFGGRSPSQAWKARMNELTSSKPSRNAISPIPRSVFARSRRADCRRTSSRTSWYVVPSSPRRRCIVRALIPRDFATFAIAGRAPHIVSLRAEAYVVDERPSTLVFRDRQLQPGEENREELGIAIDHRQRERGFVEDHDVVRRIEADLAAEMSPEHRLVRPAPGELDAPRPDRLRGSALRKAQDEREEQIGHQRRRAPPRRGATRSVVEPHRPARRSRPSRDRRDACSGRASGVPRRAWPSAETASTATSS